MERNVKIGNWHTSKEVEKELKISSCNLAHLRLEGKIEFKKVGNSFFYNNLGVEKLKNYKSINTNKSK
jgi:hypothetical protein